MKLKDFSKLLILGLVLVLSACGGGDNTNNIPNPKPDNALTGSYVGTVQFEAGDVFYTTSIASFTISKTGALTGTVKAEAPSDVPAGEEGTVTGAVTIDNVTGDAGFASIDMTVESPTLGKYTLTGGTGQYGTIAGETTFAVSGFTIKDASGTPVGTGGTIIGKKQ